MPQLLYFFGAMALLLLVIAAAQRQLARRRTAALGEAAMGMGFTFEEAPDAAGQEVAGDPWHGPAYDPAYNLWSLALFQRGRGLSTRNILRGRTEIGTTYIFDCSFITGSGKSRMTHVQTVVAFSLDHVVLPSFQLKRESIFEKVASAFGYQDIDFPANPEFSRRYLLRSDDEEKVRRLFSPDLLRFFEQAHLDGERVEGFSRWLIVYTMDSKCAPGKLSDRLAQATPVATAVAQAARSVQLV